MLFILFVISSVAVQAQELVTYEVPREMFYSAHNDDFTVKVRTLGGEWKNLYEYKVHVDMDKVQEASMVQFDMKGSVEVMVKKNNGTIREVDIRPLNNEVKYTQIRDAIFLP